MATAPAWLHKVLDDNSTDKFHIEWTSNGFDFSNHVAHGIIALWWLGATESRIRDFTKDYVQKLDPTTTDDLGNIADPEVLLGKRKRYNDLLRLYQSRLQDYKGDLRVLVQKEFPRLSAGLSCALIHGFIHLGYGWSVQSERVVCEGLAYLHHAYKPIGQVDDAEGPALNTLGQGSQNMLDVLEALRTNTNFKESVLKESKGPGNRGLHPLENKIGAMLDFHHEELFKYAHSIKFPDFWDPENLSQDQVKRIAEWVVDSAVTVYVKSRRKNDFFILHGVTAAWSLCQILPLLSPDKEILKTLRVFLSTVFCVYMLDSPILDADEEIEKDFPQMIKESVAEKRDEHIYKLVQVCHERYQADNAPKEMYLKAGHVALKHDLMF